MKKSPEKRFFEKVTVTQDCWLWRGGKTGNGYGTIFVSGQRLGTHRYSWTIHFGEIPEGMMVLHRCDNPLCVNPEHLFLGTDKENSEDKVSKGRQKAPQLFFEANGMAKLSQATALEITQRYAEETISQDQLAREYQVSQTTILRAITRGRRILRNRVKD